MDAILKLKDHDVLVSIIKNDNNEGVRLSAIYRLGSDISQDLLEDIAKHDKASSIRREVVDKLHNQETIASIAKNDTDQDVRIKAIRKLDPYKWQNLLADIAKNDKILAVRIEASSKLEIATKEIFCHICNEGIRNATREPTLDLVAILGYFCPNCYWTICFRCDPFYKIGGEFTKCPGCNGSLSSKSVNAIEDTWPSELYDEWIKQRDSEKYQHLRKKLISKRKSVESQLKMIDHFSDIDLHKVIASVERIDFSRETPHERPHSQMVADFSSGTWNDLGYFCQEYLWKDKAKAQELKRKLERSFLVKIWRKSDKEGYINAYFIRCYTMKLTLGEKPIPNFEYQEVLPPDELKFFLRNNPEQPGDEKGRSIGQFADIVWK